jgi:hypothetical protein
MSKFLLLPLLILVACSSEAPVKPDSTGTIINFEPITNTEDNERVKAVCQALSNKQNVLSVLSSSGQQYVFNYAQKRCNDSTLPAAKDVATRIVRSDSNYIFKPVNNENFGFSDVETDTLGVMAAICKESVASPIRQGSTGAIWWTTFVDAKQCQPGIGTLCVYLQRGSSADGWKFKIHTNEWIKFRVDGEKEGFFLERKLVSSAGCDKGKTLEMRAVLK